MKKTSEQEGENPSAVHAYGTPHGIPRMVYPGEVFEIPDDPVPHLNKKGEPIATVMGPKHPVTGERKFLTELENRERLIAGNGIQSQYGFYESAPLRRGMESITLPANQREAFVEKQLAAFRKYKHFNPVCMEIVPNDTPTDAEDDAARKGWVLDAPVVKEEVLDISALTVEEAKEVLARPMAVETLEYMKTQEQGDKKRSMILNLLDVAIKNANKQ
jgi:hypothetical protein